MGAFPKKIWKIPFHLSFNINTGKIEWIFLWRILFPNICVNFLVCEKHGRRWRWDVIMIYEIFLKWKMKRQRDGRRELNVGLVLRWNELSPDDKDESEENGCSQKWDVLRCPKEQLWKERKYGIRSSKSEYKIYYVSCIVNIISVIFIHPIKEKKTRWSRFNKNFDSPKWNAWNPKGIALGNIS